MSKNYTDYRRQSMNQSKPEQTPDPAAVPETPVPPVEPTPEPTQVPTPETPTAPEPPVEKPGRVVNCTKLNLRKAPSTDAEILCEMDNKTKFTVNEAESTAEFYKITLSSGIEGFCMRKYIVI